MNSNTQVLFQDLRLLHSSFHDLGTSYLNYSITKNRQQAKFQACYAFPDLSSGKQLQIQHSLIFGTTE